MGFSRDFIKGLGFIGLFRYSAKVIVFAKVLICYRYLSPREVGLFGLAAIALGLLEMFTESGINIVIVRDHRPLSYFINTAFFVSVGRGVLISLILLGSAFILPSFFNDQGLFPLLILISIIPVIKGFINPAIAAFQKNLQFHKEATLRFSVVVFETIVAIILVRTIGGAASLIIAMIMAALLEVVVSYLAIKPWPRLEFDRVVFGEIVNPGKWINVAGIITYAEQNFDNVIVGKLLGATNLGYYQTAFSLTRGGITEGGTAVSQVLFPIVSRLQHEPRRLWRAMLRAIIPAAFLLAIPVVLLNIPFVREILLALLKDKWRPAFALLPYLSLSAFLTAINIMLVPLFLVKNRLRIQVMLYATGLAFMLVAMLYLTPKAGIIGAAQAVLIARIALQPLFFWHTVKLARKTK